MLSCYKARFILLEVAQQDKKTILATLPTAP